MLSKTKENCQNKFPGCGRLHKDQHDFAVMGKVFTSNVQFCFFVFFVCMFVSLFSQHYGPITVYYNITQCNFEYFEVMVVQSRFTDI